MIMDKQSSIHSNNLMKSPQATLPGGQFNSQLPIKAMNRTITHPEQQQQRNMTFDDIHSGNTISGAYTHQSSHQNAIANQSSQLQPISELDPQNNHNSMYNSQMNHNKYPQPLTRKTKGSWREGK